MTGPPTPDTGLELAGLLLLQPRLAVTVGPAAEVVRVVDGDVLARCVGDGRRRDVPALDGPGALLVDRVGTRGRVERLRVALLRGGVVGVAAATLPLAGAADGGGSDVAAEVV